MARYSFSRRFQLANAAVQDTVDVSAYSSMELTSSVEGVWGSAVVTYEGSLDHVADPTKSYSPLLDLRTGLPVELSASVSTAVVDVSAMSSIRTAVTTIGGADVAVVAAVLTDEVPDLPDLVYSSSPVWTGEYWTDGKPIYVVVVDTGALPNTSLKATPHGLTFDEIISVQGSARNSTTGASVPLTN